MPMVLALVVVVGVMSAVMLERQTAQRLVVARQLGWYQEHHARLGLQEGIEAWLRALPNTLDIGAALPPDGHFLDLELRDGTRAVVYLLERQNAVLTDLAAVEDASVDAAAAIAEAVALAFGEKGPPDGLRTIGPAALSVHTASPELLQVAAAAVIGDSGGASLFATSLINDRESNGGRCTPSAIGLAASAAGVENETRSLLSRMFTVRPTLYYATVELRDSGQGPPLARYGGYFSVGTGRGATGATRSAFLTWENLGVE
jgi:hypothetical protein